MTRVNPPPELRIPKKILQDPELREYFQARDFNMFQLWKRVGGGTDIVEEANRFKQKSQAEFNAINERLGSGDALTSDETGFTVDLDTLSVDMTEA